MTLRVVPVGVRAARRIVEAMHAHHHAPPGALFCVGVADDDRLACVAIVSRPVARVPWNLLRLAPEAAGDHRAISAENLEVTQTVVMQRTRVWRRG